MLHLSKSLHNWTNINNSSTLFDATHKLHILFKKIETQVKKKLPSQDLVVTRSSIWLWHVKGKSHINATRLSLHNTEEVYHFFSSFYLISQINEVYLFFSLFFFLFCFTTLSAFLINEVNNHNKLTVYLFDSSTNWLVSSPSNTWQFTNK